jgi:hypothetical protein
MLPVGNVMRLPKCLIERIDERAPVEARGNASGIEDLHDRIVIRTRDARGRPEIIDGPRSPPAAQITFNSRSGAPAR